MHHLHCLPDDRDIDIDASQTILQALLTADIPQAHVCGGNAFCSTCRIMVLDGIEHCSSPTKAEGILTKKLDFPVHVRLACQTKITGNVAIRRMVLDSEDMDIVESQLSVGVSGKEKSVVLLQAAIRGATNFDEVNFPYDIVYVMGRYFYRMNKIVTQYGGCINNYMGVKLMAVFGMEPLDRITERAVWSGLEMLLSIKTLNAQLATLAYRPLEVSIGIHSGTVVPVAIDPARPDLQTVMGDTVNLVGRVEAANRDLGTELLVSETVYNVLREQAIVGCNQTVRTQDSDRHKLYEIVGMRGMAPAKIEKSGKTDANESRVGGLGSLMKKFSESWGKK